jgi:hypothetical protein
MKKMIYAIFFLFISICTQINPQQLVIDKFDNLTNWKEITSDGAKINLNIQRGLNGGFLRIDYEFNGAGYCGIEKEFPFTLPTNYKFTFHLKGISPKNNLEFKLVDKSGDNVWWKNQRNFDFPSDWEKIIIKKRDIEFAWGPIGGGEVKNFEKLQIIIAAAEGGKGTIFLDDLGFEEIPLPNDLNAKPIVYSSSPADNNLSAILDNKMSTLWRSKTKSNRQYLLIDFQFTKEIGGFVIHWDENDFASDFDISISNDRVRWEKVFGLSNNNLTRNFIYLKNADARYVRFNFTNNSRNKGYAIKEIEIKDIQFSQSLNNFFTKVAGYYKEGSFPKYFYDKQSYWTVIGVSEDLREGLINEQGTIEVDKASFSIEPFIQLKDQLITWNDVQLKQSLENNYLPIPSVTWVHPSFKLEIKTFADGEPNNSALMIRYRLTNASEKTISGKLSIAVRPYQVNPKWQFLNNEGGVSRIKELYFNGKEATVNNDKMIIPLTQPNEFGATKFYDGEIIDYLLKNSLPINQSVKDEFGFASGCMSYDFNLQPGKYKDFIFSIPFYKTSEEFLSDVKVDPTKYFDDKLNDEITFWKEKLDKINIQLPPSGEKLINTLKTYLGYILINKDGPAIQPGSRSYERSWIRDGALTSSALLRLGLKEEVKNYLDWFSQYQFPTGKIPCVVHKRGADPTPENDSHGEYIYALLQYFKFTHDTLFLKDKLQNIVRAVNYIELLTNQRKTDQYKKKDSTMFYGLMPESISHEGYSAKPMHSYWDDFFTIRGLRDATEIAQILNEKELKERFLKLRDDFETNLQNSIKIAINRHKIDYIPGCAELGDFDATSTTIAIFPGNEQKSLPEKELLNTFNKYYDFFLNRMSSKTDWINYTPYELRIVGSFIYLNQREKAHKLLDFFFNNQRPKAWNHWAEVVWKNIDEPRFIGDMPHTWVGSDYVNAVRAMFVYENDLDTSLILGAGLKEEWIDSPEGVSIIKMPTYYGNVSYTIKKSQNGYQINLSADLEIKNEKIILKNFKKEIPSKVLIDNVISNNYDLNEIVIDKIPSTIFITY